MGAVAPVPVLYLRWHDPETMRVVRMERVPGQVPFAGLFPFDVRDHREVHP